MRTIAYRTLGGAWLALLLAAGACSGTSSAGLQSDRNETGLEGTVRRGPIEPVCREGQPCDAPVAADFTLQRNGRVVTRFASDAAGHFLVYVSPGTYQVVPDQMVGIGVQALEVVVQPEGLTHVDLMFDTGIR